MDPRGIDPAIWVLGQLGDAMLTGGRPCWGLEPGCPWYDVPPQQTPGYREPVPGYRPGATFGGPLIVTPDEVLTRIGLVDAKVRSLDLDMQQLAQGTPLLANWTSFKASWDHFVATHKGTLDIVSPPGPGTGTVNRQVDDFEGQLAGFQATLQAQHPGVHLSTPPITSSNASSPGAQPSTSSGLPWWAIAGLTVGGLAVVGYAGYKLYEKFSPTAHIARALSHDPSAFGAQSDPDSPRQRGYVGMPIYY